MMRHGARLCSVSRAAVMGARAAAVSRAVLATPTTIPAISGAAAAPSPLSVHRGLKTWGAQYAKEGEDPEFIELIRDFLEPAQFYQALKNIGCEAYFGVPDSLLKDFCAYVTTTTAPQNHVITANEGAAVGMAAGYYLATKKFPVVYLQNSGIGNVVNPIMSLAHPDVYRIPMLLLIGWRGEPGKKDEPQHVVQGETTPAILASMGIPFQVLPDYIEGAEKTLATAKSYLQSSSGPYALLIRKRTFTKFSLPKPENKYELNREAALKVVVESLHPKDVVVSTTGMLSRELFEQREFLGHSHEKDFLTVGSMGHAPAVALGISQAKPSRRVFCLDGDGAALMHLGTYATVGNKAHSNFKHILFNNAAHDSVGGQPTVCGAPNFDFQKIAQGCGYVKTFVATTAEEIRKGFAELSAVNNGPALLEIKINPGGWRADLGRPTRTPIQNKEDLMQFLDRV